MSLIIDNPASARAPEADEAAFAAARLAEPAIPRAGQSRAPAGSLITIPLEHSRVFPEARRDVRVYLPKGHDRTAPANLLVFQDGLAYLADSFGAAAAIDDLVEAGELGSTVAIFVEPGDLIGYPAAVRGNRSLEYDSIDDAYVRLLVDEILPAATVGLAISEDPRRRVICGMSSGGIAAFNAAWHRSDQFGVVVSHCGSFVNLRGGGVYPSLVRNGAIRPLRVFLQSGIKDMDRVAGSWPVANHDMAAALKLKGYDYRFEFGLGGHDPGHGAAVFPQTLRWAFRGL